MQYVVNTLIQGGKLEEKSFPSKAKFFSKLKNEGIYNRNYKHAQRVRNAFTLKEIKEHVPLYNMQDVLKSLTVEINFMENISSKFCLDPVNFVTLASFLWECAVKVTKMELEFVNSCLHGTWLRKWY